MTTAAGRVVLTFDIDDKGLVKGLGALPGHVKDAGAEIRKQGQQLKDWGQGLTTYVTAPILGIGAAALAVGVDFDRSMNSIQGVLRPTAEQMDRIRETAIKMGAETAFSATDAADAILELGKAGMDTDTAIASVDEVLQLAAASGLSMADSASMAARTLNAFNLEASDLGHVNDVLAASFNATSLEIGDMQVAFGYVGPIATGFGMSIETVSAALGIMRDNGIAAETTGRALREGFTRLVNPTKDVRDAMEELGIESFKTADGSMMPLADIVGILEKKGITAGQAMKMFGDAAGPGMFALVSKGRGALEDLTTKLEQSDGAAKAMADAMMTGLPGAIERLKGSVETAMLSISRAIAPTAILVMDFLGGAADLITEDVIPAFTDLPQPIQATAIGLLGMFAAAGPALLVAGKLVTAWGEVSTALGITGFAGAALLAAKAIGIVAAAWAGWEIGKWLAGPPEQLAKSTDMTRRQLEQYGDTIGKAVDPTAQLVDMQKQLAASMDEATQSAGTRMRSAAELNKQEDAAKKYLKALADELERQKGLVRDLGITTKEDLVTAMEEFETTLQAATRAGIPLDRTLAALRPNLVALMKDAKASGLATGDLEEALAELDATVVRLRGGIPQLNAVISTTVPLMGQWASNVRTVTAEELEATTQTWRLTQAREALGVTSQASLEKTAQTARDAYATMAAAGWESAAQEQAARQAVLDAEIAAGQRTVSIWTTEILPGVQGALSMLSGNMSTALTDMLTGQMSFRDASVVIWQSFQQAAMSILDTILNAFLNNFLQGMLGGLMGWAQQAGKIIGGVGQQGAAAFGGQMITQLAAPGAGAAAAGTGGGVLGALGAIGGFAAGAAAPFVLGRMVNPGPMGHGPEASAELERQAFFDGAAYLGRTPEEHAAAMGVSVPGFSDGGIVDAGAGGLSILHGTELVAPLPPDFDLAKTLRSVGNQRVVVENRIYLDGTEMTRYQARTLLRELDFVGARG